jgi:hypothetical protein
MATGQCYSGGKQLSVYPLTFYHPVVFSVYSSNTPCITRKGHLEMIQAAFNLRIKQLLKCLYQ